MAVANITGFSVGQDLQTLLLTPNNGGAAINAESLGRLLDFSATPVIHELEMTPVTNGGIRLVRNVYRGWDMEATFGRFQGNLSYLMAAIMGQFNINGLESYFTITAQVLNSANGSQLVDTYTWTNVVISNVSTGNFGETSRVEQRMTMRGQQLLINGNAPTSTAALPYQGGNIG